MLYASTKKKIQKIQQEVDSITDGTGLPIDLLIKPSVIAFKLCDFPTSGSCQGHANWGLPYPWIDIDCEFWNTKEFWSLRDPDTNLFPNGFENNPIWQNYCTITKVENDKHLDKFQGLLADYQNIPHVDCRDINIEYFGIFGGFRVRASSIEKMNKFADYLVRRYDFCSSSELAPAPIYMNVKDYQDLLEWSKQNESSTKNDAQIS